MGASCGCMEKKKLVHKIEPKVPQQEEPKPEEKIFVISDNIKFEPIKEDPPSKSETPQQMLEKKEEEDEKLDKVTPLTAAAPVEKPVEKKFM